MRYEIKLIRGRGGEGLGYLGAEGDSLPHALIKLLKIVLEDNDPATVKSLNDGLESMEVVAFQEDTKNAIEDAAPRDGRPGRPLVIWSHEHMAWWRSGGLGYTVNLDQAGRYTAAEAFHPVVNDVHHNEIAIPYETAVKRGAPSYHPYLGVTGFQEANKERLKT